MKSFLISIFILLSFNLPINSHGNNKNCSNDCNDYYCPNENIQTEEKN